MKMKKRTNKLTKKKYLVASQASMFRREIELPETLQPETEAPTMPEKISEKQSANPKINWSKNVKMNKCTGNAPKESMA